MTQAERQARNSSNNIAGQFSIASVAATAFGAAAAGVSIGGMVAFANETINMGNEIKKFSQLANTSIHDFQYYAKGAETAGISMESFADKLKDMQDRYDFHRTGGGPLADFFEHYWHQKLELRFSNFKRFHSDAPAHYSPFAKSE